MPRPVTEQLYDSQEGIHVVLGLYSLLSSIMAHQPSNHCAHQPGMSAQLQPGHLSVTFASRMRALNPSDLMRFSTTALFMAKPRTVVPGVLASVFVNVHLMSMLTYVVQMPLERGTDTETTPHACD